MRAIKPNTRHRSLQRTVLLALVAILIGGAGTVALLGATKVIDLGKLAFWREKEKPIPANWVAIPRCARPIERYTKVTAEYLTNPLTGGWFVTYVPPDKVPAGVIRDPKQILFRVTAYEKKAGLFFSEADFLPVGTQPGIVGGIPLGKRAITLDASKLKGVYDLKEGDHVDLLASTPVDMPGAGRSNSGRLGTSVVGSPNIDLLLPKQSYVRPLVQDGVVVTPEHTRYVPISSSTLMQGATTRTIPMQEVVLAVEPEEVARLAEAMDLKYEITCVARSGRPASATSPAAHPSVDKHPKGDTSTKNRVAMDITPGLNPMAPIRFMEVMIGPQRQFVLFTGPGHSPVVESQDDGSGKAASPVAPATVVAERTQ